MSLEALVRWRAPDPRARAPERLHPDRRGERAHRRHRPPGARQGLPRHPRVAEAPPDRHASRSRSTSRPASSRIPSSSPTSSKILRDTGLPAADLTLEITETALMHDPDVAIGRLHELKAGRRAARDRRLRHRLLVTRLAATPAGRHAQDRQELHRSRSRAARRPPAWCTRSIRLAGTLQLDIVAEGVEHDDQVRRLEELGCDQIQGFCFSQAARAGRHRRPAPAGGAGRPRVRHSSRRRPRPQLTHRPTTTVR